MHQNRELLSGRQSALQGDPLAVRLAYVDNVTSFVDLALEQNRRGDQVYVGLQPRPIGLPKEELNVWWPARGGAAGNVAKAEDIEFVMNVALDIDVDTPARRTGHPASDEELKPCVEVAQRVLTLEDFGGTAAIALSGNGVYVINPITPVQVGTDTGSLLKVMERRWIAAARPLPAGVRIDPIMDLSRIIRVIGTVNYKGSPVSGRPHRRSCFLVSPMTGGRQHLLAEQMRYMSLPTEHAATETTRAQPQPVRGNLEQFETCEFVRWIGRNAPAVLEPAWMDFLTQCAWLEGGDAVAHRLSGRDSVRYTHQETQTRLDRIRRAGYRPKTCRDLSGSAGGQFDCPRLQTCSANRPLELAATTNDEEVCPVNMHKTTDSGKVPRYVVRCGAVSATTWSNTRTVSGELREYVQVELVRNYRDEGGNWCKTSRFWPEDLLALAIVARRVFETLKVSERWPAAEIQEEGAGCGESQPKHEGGNEPGESHGPSDRADGQA